jgi:hypothetical protein
MRRPCAQALEHFSFEGGWAGVLEHTQSPLKAN